jgi:hypothetical protein
MRTPRNCAHLSHHAPGVLPWRYHGIGCNEYPGDFTNTAALLQWPRHEDEEKAEDIQRCPFLTEEVANLTHLIDMGPLHRRPRIMTFVVIQ